MKIGDRVTFRSEKTEHIAHGTVIWLHPRRRFALVGFRVMTPFGWSPEIRECLQIITGVIDTRTRVDQELNESLEDCRKRRK